jgi:hypothetical protein
LDRATVSTVSGKQWQVMSPWTRLVTLGNSGWQWEEATGLRPSQHTMAGTGVPVDHHSASLGSQGELLGVQTASCRHCAPLAKETWPVLQAGSLGLPSGELQRDHKWALFKNKRLRRLPWWLWQKGDCFRPGVVFDVILSGDGTDVWSEAHQQFSLPRGEGREEESLARSRWESVLLSSDRHVCLEPSHNNRSLMT